MNDFPITPAGHNRLKRDLDDLKKQRPKISLEIGTARELGDLSENFEYHAAKDKQGMMEAKIRVMEDQLARANIIDPSKLSGDRVVFGGKVTLLDLDSDEETTYQIVGEIEADVSRGRINVSSPLARALIGKEVGDEAKVPGKGGPRVVEVSDVIFEPVEL